MAELKKIGVLTSGGDAPGMNAAIRSVVRSCIYYGVEPVAIREGYKGLIDNNLEVVNARSVANIINQGGTFLKSARCQEFRTPEAGLKRLQTPRQRVWMHWLLLVVTVPLPAPC